MTTIDLNCDMGESFGAWSMGADKAVMPWITSANIACGFHAGDPSIMRHTLAAAAAAGVAVGAHVGLPDLAGFGRRVMAVTTAQVHDFTAYQLGALMAMARTTGTTVAHVKAHGALYHMTEDDPELAMALARAVSEIDAGLRLYGRAGGRMVAVGQGMGLAVAHEAFVDRRYQADGHLVPRGHAQAVINDVEAAAAQALSLVLHGKATSIDGNSVSVHADTLCIHGDRDNAEVFAHAVHQALRDAGITLRALGKAD